MNYVEFKAFLAAKKEATPSLNAVVMVAASEKRQRIDAKLQAAYAEKSKK